MKSILRDSGIDIESIKDKGAIILGAVTFDCNLDYDVKDCDPVFNWRRIDTTKDSLSKGFNFREVNFHGIYF